MKTNMPSETHLAKHLLISLPMALEKLVRWVGRKDLAKAPGKAASWGGLAVRSASCLRLISILLSCHWRTINYDIPSLCRWSNNHKCSQIRYSRYPALVPSFYILYPLLLSSFSPTMSCSLKYNFFLCSSGFLLPSCLGFPLVSRQRGEEAVRITGWYLLLWVSQDRDHALIH